MTVQRFFNRGLVKTMITGDCSENVTVREVTVGECDCNLNFLVSKHPEAGTVSWMHMSQIYFKETLKLEIFYWVQMEVCK